MKDNDLVEVEIKHGDDKILLKRSHPNQPMISAIPMMGPAIAGANTTPLSIDNANSDTQKDDGFTEIKSPMVGTFYATPSPDSDSFVEIGSHVDPQTVICIIEAMKVMNEIKSEINGEVVEILVSNGQAIEFGQPLFKVKPN